MKHFVFLFIVFTSFSVFSQGVTENIIDPIIDENLKVPYWDSNYYGQPIYIVNDNYVVYEEPKTRIIINENYKSFKTIKKYKTKFGLGKNGVYSRGKLITADTTGFTI